MSIMELGALGEFVGSIGVIVTLIYLAIQIRAGARATNAQTLQEIQRDQREAFQANVENWEAVTKAETGEDLSAKEGNYVYLYALRTLRLFENQWYQKHMGALDTSLYEGYSQHIYLSFQSPALTQVWNRTKARGFFHPDFVQHVEVMLEEPPDWYDVRSSQ